MALDRSIRLSQIVSSFGVGAVYDSRGESVGLCDLGYWVESPFFSKGRIIGAERLIISLNAGGHRIAELREPKTVSGRPGKGRGKGRLPYMRFPRWLFCSKCRRMKKWTFRDERTGESPTCPHCGIRQKLSPMRFIVICANGHMSDVPWTEWAHSKTTKPHQLSCRSEDLEFLTGGIKSGGLESIAVSCRQCEASRNLGGITAPHALRSIGQGCRGKQPWQSADKAEDCTRDAHVVQRGAGNVYYPRVRSAITIPPESCQGRSRHDFGELIRTHAEFALLLSSKHNPAAAALEDFLIPRIMEDLGCTDSDIRRELTRGDAGAPGSDEIDIESEEWQALTEPVAEQDDRDLFVTRHEPLAAEGAGEMEQRLATKISLLVSVVKLREVRVLTGFFRYHPGGSDEGGAEARPVRPDAGRGLPWLPATEVFGEGVFLTLDEEKLQKWEVDPAVAMRVRTLGARADQSTFAALFPKQVSARYILLHTLSHLLIRRLAFECGYSSASLRERIYCQGTESGAPRAGILIYTAAGDAEGTLGGLARQAKASRLTTTLLSSLQDAACCSADPICLESQSQGLDGLNLAACHACSLVAETSCESFNLLLDRALLIGGDGMRGFFEEELAAGLELSLSLTALSPSV